MAISAAEGPQGASCNPVNVCSSRAGRGQRERPGTATFSKPVWSVKEIGRACKSSAAGALRGFVGQLARRARRCCCRQLPAASCRLPALHPCPPSRSHQPGAAALISFTQSHSTAAQLL